MRKQSGFTLIELIVVIVILGILAVVAAPKFIDLQADARIAAVNGMKASIQDAMKLSYARASILGVNNVGGTYVICPNQPATQECNQKTPGEDTITIKYGYPAATQDGLPRAIENLSFLEGSEWLAAVKSRVKSGDNWRTITSITQSSEGKDITATSYTTSQSDYSGCGVVYIEAGSATVPAIVFTVTNDC